jgi:hypothetical protein
MAVVPARQAILACGINCFETVHVVFINLSRILLSKGVDAGGVRLPPLQQSVFSLADPRIFQPNPTPD